MSLDRRIKLQPHRTHAVGLFVASGENTCALTGDFLDDTLTLKGV